MEIEFKTIFEFVNSHILWFIIPINLIIITLLVIVIVKYLKERKLRERSSKTKLSRNAKKKHKV